MKNYLFSALALLLFVGVNAQETLDIACPAPNMAYISTIRTSETTASFIGADPDFTYEGTANIASRGFLPGPKFGMDNMSMPWTQTGLVPSFDYNVWFRTECPGDTYSEWVGPFYVPLYCGDATGVTITRDSGTAGTITADDTLGTYDLYIVLEGGPAPAPNAPVNIHGDDDITFPHTRNDLSPYYTYDVYVRKQCDESNTTEWDGPYLVPAWGAVARPAISPNPTNGLVKIEGMKAVSAQVMSITGKSELTTKVVNNELNVSNLAPGQYILNVTDAKGNVQSLQFIKK